ncbi:MAG: hypothetical protein AAB668_04480 [Patescibacteria group bacterium]
MNQENIQNIFIGLLVAGLILIGAGMYLVSQQVQSVANSVKQIQQGIDETKPVAQPSSTDTKKIPTVMAQVGPFELMTGSFTFKVVCEGKMFVPPTGGRDSDARTTCTGLNKLVVVRDERLTGVDKVEEKTIATITTTADTDAELHAEIVTAGEATAIMIDFHENDPMDEGVCMPYGYNYLYDTVAPGALKQLYNYPDQAGTGVWAYGVMAYVNGCASGAAYPVEPVMIYDPATDKSIVVTEARGVPAHLWDGRDEGYPNQGWSGTGDKGSPFWSDLKWNDIDLRFEINLHLIDGRIQPYWFDKNGKDVTPDVF